MHWSQTIDASLFHWVNPTLSNSFLDVLMPFISGNHFFAPALLATAALLLWKGGARGRIFVAMLVLAIVLGDSLVINTLKQLLQRHRPFLALADVHMPPGVGRTDSGSMPSAHAANWFAATMVAFIYYRRSLWFILPMALLVSFSRIYNGVHYPSDIVVGAILGAGYAAGGVWTLDALWRGTGRRWFPFWWQRVPSLLNPVIVKQREVEPDAELLKQHWMRLGYVLIFAQLAANLAYIASGIITLSEDEAYQWIWSKHLALSYYSKPPLIALTQFLGTHIWGDTVFGVRFFAPVLGAITSICLLRFMAKVANARAAFWLILITPAVPLISVGSTLMTIDPLSVTFWLLAMMAGWRAIQADATTRDWLWVGLWMGLGFLSKYTALYQLLSWVVLFALYAPARRQLRLPGPWLGLLVNLLCTIPVVVWNSRHDWITLKHVSEGGRFNEPWAPTLAYLWKGFTHYTLEFIGTETALLNPFFFLPMMATAVIFWRLKPRSPLLIYFFSMGAPLFLIHLLWTFHSRVLPNWIAPSILPLLCLAVVYWEARWRDRAQPLKTCLVGGLIFGLTAAVVLRDTNIVTKFTGGQGLPPALDSTSRVKGWAETAQLVETARQKLLTEGAPVFIICETYGLTGEMTFNLPEAKAGVPDHPLVYCHTSATSINQFYYWPGYRDHKGQNALYLEVLDLMDTNTYSIPNFLTEEFESATNIGTVLAVHQGRPMHRILIIECRALR